MGSCTLTVVASQTKHEILCRCSRLSGLCLCRSCPRCLCWLRLCWLPCWLCCCPLCLWLHRLRGCPARGLRCRPPCRSLRWSRPLCSLRQPLPRCRALRRRSGCCRALHPPGAHRCGRPRSRGCPRPGLQLRRCPSRCSSCCPSCCLQLCCCPSCLQLQLRICSRCLPPCRCPDRLSDAIQCLTMKTFREDT